MSFGEAVSSGFANYATFSGRATRSAYWWWALFQALAVSAGTLIDRLLHTGSINDQFYYAGWVSTLVSLALFLPSLAVSVRRLHDTDRSGWWLLIGIIPIVGWLVLLYFFVIAGTPGVNRFGPPMNGAYAAGAMGYPSDRM